MSICHHPPPPQGGGATGPQDTLAFLGFGFPHASAIIVPTPPQGPSNLPGFGISGLTPAWVQEPPTTPVR